MGAHFGKSLTCNDWQHEAFFRCVLAGALMALNMVPFQMGKVPNKDHKGILCQAKAVKQEESALPTDLVSKYSLC